MTSLPPASAWAKARFGETAAESVRERVVSALAEMQSIAEQAHRIARQSTRHTYGITRWRGQFDRFADIVGGEDGARLIKPPRCSFHLVAVGDSLLYPFLYATDLNVNVKHASLPQPVSELTRTLFRSFSKHSRSHQEELFTVELHQAAVFREVGSDTRLVLVPYASNLDAGLLTAWWGEGSLCADGTVAWTDGMPESLPIQLPDDSQRKPLGLAGTASESVKPFDQGEEPSLDFPPRQPGTLPSSEKDQPDPEAEGNGQP